jgi:hypothetical protein
MPAEGSSSRRCDMLSWAIRRKLDAFEGEYDYDVSYLRDVLETSPKAMWMFHRATALGTFRQGIPKDVWYAARLVAMRLEDCGPCTQLVSTMAERDGQDSRMIRAILHGTLEDLSDDVRLSVELTRACLARDPRADALRAEVVAKWGRMGLLSLAFAMLSSRLYPTLKYALGYGHTCVVVRVGGEAVLTPREAL